MQITCFDGVAICIEGLINATPKYQVYGIRNNMSYNFYFHKRTRVGEGVKLHQQFHIRHTHNILSLVLLRH